MRLRLGKHAAFAAVYPTFIPAAPDAARDGAPARLDATALAGIRGLQRDGTPDLLLKIIDLYMNSAPENVARIKQAAADGNAEALRAAAHCLKSSSANLGASRLAELCMELEQMGRDGRLENAGTAADVLEFEFEAVCRALEAERGAEISVA